MMALLAMMAVLFGTTACGGSIFGQTRIKGSGNLITRTVAVGNFHTIDASRGVKVLLTDEPGDIEICADDNLIEYVRVGIDGGELKITVAPRIHAVPSEQILVRVPYNGNIRKLEASSAAKIVAKTLFTGRMLEIEASSAARIRVDAQVETCEIDASSSAKVVAQIDADRLEADASSASSILLQGRCRKRCSKPLPLRRSMPGAWSHTSARRRRRALPIFGSIASRLCNPERRAPEAFPMLDRAV